MLLKISTNEESYRLKFGAILWMNSHAIIPWMKRAGMPYFGSGNLNHFITRMKYYIVDKCGIENLNDIDITLVSLSRIRIINKSIV